MEQLTYLTPEELQDLSLDELQALWELVPTERQKAYRAAYEREVRSAGAIGSDALETQVAAELLRRYIESALVPVGTRWAKAPQRVQAAAKTNDLPDATDEAAPLMSRPSPQVIAVIGVLITLFLGFILLRLFTGGGEIEVEPTPEITFTPTPENSPTPTPLALEAQDEVINGGDSERAVAYPVNLQVLLPDETALCVWVVQRRQVAAAEWHYDPNPDIASFVKGMSVRSVIGIPHSQDNFSV